MDHTTVSPWVSSNWTYTTSSYGEQGGGGRGGGQGARLSPWKLPLSSSISEWNRCFERDTDTHEQDTFTKRGIVRAKLITAYTVTQCDYAELLHAVLAHSTETFKVTFKARYFVCAANSSRLPALVIRRLSCHNFLKPINAHIPKTDLFQPQYSSFLFSPLKTNTT